MAAYEDWLKGYSDGNGASTGQLSSLVSGILAGAALEGEESGAEGSTILLRLLDGVTGSIPAEYERKRQDAVQGGVNEAFSTLRTLGTTSLVPAANISGSGAWGMNEVIPLPLRGVGGLLGGLLGLFQRSSHNHSTATNLSAAVEFPEPRNPNMAIGPAGQRSYGLDYRFDGQPRSAPTDSPAERRVEIHIQALDARSILDRKEELAEAVRQALSSSGVTREGLLGY